MKAQINDEGVLEFKRGGVLWEKQMCIHATQFNPLKTFCAVDCPLMGEPLKEKETGVYLLSCCDFEICSETSFYSNGKGRK